MTKKIWNLGIPAKGELKEKLNAMLEEHNRMVEESEAKLIAFALQHNLELYMGEYGRDGRTLVHTDRCDREDEEDYETGGRDRGEWVYSSETC